MSLIGKSPAMPSWELTILNWLTPLPASFAKDISRHFSYFIKRFATYIFHSNQRFCQTSLLVQGGQ